MSGGWKLGLFTAVFVGAIGGSAEALPIITGGFSWSGNVIPVDINGVATTDLATATGLDFVPDGTTDLTPGTPGPFVVNSASGTFATIGIGGSLAGDFGGIKDVSFAGPGSASYPLAPIALFESIGGVTFDLTSLVIGFQNEMFLNLTGTGVFKIAGFEDSVGVLRFSGNTAGGTFSFSSSNAAVPDTGSAAPMLALGLMGLAAMRRTFAR